LQFYANDGAGRIAALLAAASAFVRGNVGVVEQRLSSDLHQLKITALASFRNERTMRAAAEC
jgi:hypothetical protein